MGEVQDNNPMKDKAPSEQAVRQQQVRDGHFKAPNDPPVGSTSDSEPSSASDAEVKNGLEHLPEMSDAQASEPDSEPKDDEGDDGNA